jgi:hypothetical protein
VAARKQKQRRMSAQVVEDEDYQLRYEIVAGIDVAKESAVVCVRMPPAEGRMHRRSHLQTVPATVPAIGELAASCRRQGCRWCRWRPHWLSGVFKINNRVPAGRALTSASTTRRSKAAATTHSGPMGSAVSCLRHGRSCR